MTQNLDLTHVETDLAEGELRMMRRLAQAEKPWRQDVGRGAWLEVPPPGTDVVYHGPNGSQPVNITDKDAVELIAAYNAHVAAEKEKAS